MDAATAAILGAITGAAASILVTIIDRFVTLRIARKDRESSTRSELRTILLEHEDALLAEFGAPAGSKELAEARNRALRAIGRLELYVDKRDDSIITMASSSAREVGLGSPIAAEAISSYFVELGLWFRRSKSADEAAASFKRDIAQARSSATTEIGRT